MLVLLLFTTLAQAAMPLPDYDRALARGKWIEVNSLIERSCSFEPHQQAFVCNEDVDTAIERAEAFQDTVLRDAGLEYLMGLAYKYKGKDSWAKEKYRSAIALDPEMSEAWYDLGEILLADLRLDEAEEAFQHVSELVDEGNKSWVGPWRLAEVAAHRKDAAAFEAHMREALRRGFTFRYIAGLPNWQGFYAEPALRDSIEKLVTVYGDPSILESLAPHQD